MCEIKFRAWDKKMKEIISVDDINFKMRMINTKSAWRMFDEVVLMQFTGLHDADGTEIYEGYLIQVGDTIWLVEPIGTEERDGDKYGICVSLFGNGEAYFIDRSILMGKVIGNIFEQPHLLEKEGLMDWLDEYEDDLRRKNIFGDPDGVESVLVEKEMVAKLIAAVRMAEKALGYFERGSFVNDSASSGYAKHIRVKLQSGEFGNEP